MLRILGCLTIDHYLPLVLLAAAVCVFGMAASLAVCGRAIRGEHTRLWLALLAVCSGSTVWATHFLAMLSYRASMPMTYETGITFASYLLGVVIMGVGFAISLSRHDNAASAAVGGATVGAGVTILHYVGMAALRFPGELRYDMDLVVASVVFSLGFGGAALYAVTCRKRPALRPATIALLVAMTVALHFTAMGAVQVDISPLPEGTANGISRSVLAIAVTVAACTVVLISILGAIVDYASPSGSPQKPSGSVHSPTVPWKLWSYTATSSLSMPTRQ